MAVRRTTAETTVTAGGLKTQWMDGGRSKEMK